MFQILFLTMKVIRKENREMKTMKTHRKKSLKSSWTRSFLREPHLCFTQKNWGSNRKVHELGSWGSRLTKNRFTLSTNIRHAVHKVI